MMECGDDDDEECHNCGMMKIVDEGRLWNEQVHESFLGKLQKLHEDEQFSDVKIVVGGKEYKCHRIILSAHSEYFHTMFTSEFQESKEKCVHLESPVTRHCFDKIIRYMYHGERIIEDENAISILKLADYLQIHHLVKESALRLERNIDVKNCFKRLKIARECNLDVLRDAVVYFMIKQFKSLIDNYRDKFFQLDKEDFIEIISDENLNTISERSVCNLAVHWLLYSFETRKNEFEDVLKVLKFPLVNSEYLINFSQMFPQLQSLPYVQQYINEGLTHQLVPTKRKNTDTFRSLHRVNQDMIDVLMIIGGENQMLGLINEWNIAPVDAFLRDERHHFDWKPLPNLQNFIKTPGMLITVFGNSELYLIGSSNDGATRGHNYKYNGITGRFIKAAGPPTTHRVEGSLSECIGDFIYIIGGIDYGDEPSETVSRYNTKQDVWENVGCLIEPVSTSLSLSGIIGTRIYIFQKRLFRGFEATYFQVYDTKTDSCYKHDLFHFDPDYILGFPEACVSRNDAIYLYTGMDKPVKCVSMVKLTDSNGMKFEQIGERFHADALLTGCEMLYLDSSLYIFGGREEYDHLSADMVDELYHERDSEAIIRFCLVNKKFYQADIVIPKPLCSFMIQRFTARKDVLKTGSVGKGQIT